MRSAMFINTRPGKSRQFQPTLKSLIKAVGGQLLLCVSRCQMAKMLDDCGLPRFKVGEPARHFFHLSLDAILTSLEPLEVFEHEIVNCVVHFSPSIFVRAIQLNRFIAAGAIAFKGLEPPWPIPPGGKW